MGKSKTNMKFNAGKAKSAKNIKKNMSKGGGFGNMLWITKDTSKTVRIIAEPRDWIEYNWVGVEERTDGSAMQFRKLPTFEGYDDEYDIGSQRVRTSYAIPVVEIDEDGKASDKVMYYEPAQKVLDNMLNRFERRKTLTDCDVEIIREGGGKQTKYDLYWEDAKGRKKVLEMLESAPDFDDELLRMVKEFEDEFNKSSDDDEDEEDTPKSKKSKGKTKAAKKRAMVEEEDDEDDEDEESQDESDDDDEESSEEEADDDESSEEENGEVPSEDEINKMEFAALKALAAAQGVEVEKGKKSKGYRDALIAALHSGTEDDDDEESDEEDEGGEDRVDGKFTVSNIDEQAFTVDLTDTDDNEYETVYLDRERDDIDALEDGGVYTLVIEKDEDDDWVAVTQPKAAKKASKQGGGKGKSRKK